jgi:hypothetical protein
MLGDGRLTAPTREFALLEADFPFRISRILVAVGTTIADRPPHRSVRARLRIRLLFRMDGVEASVRIGMQSAGLRNPSVQDGSEPIPTDLCTLATAN